MRVVGAHSHRPRTLRRLTVTDFMRAYYLFRNRINDAAMNRFTRSRSRELARETMTDMAYQIRMSASRVRYRPMGHRNGARCRDFVIVFRGFWRLRSRKICLAHCWFYILRFV